MSIADHKAVDIFWSWWPAWWILPYEWDACLDLYNWEFSWSTLPFNCLWEVATSIPQWSLINIFFWSQFAFWTFGFGTCLVFGWFPFIGWGWVFLWFVIFIAVLGFYDFIFFAGRTIAIPADFLGPWNLIGGTEIWAFYQLCLVGISVVIFLILFIPELFGIDPLFDPRTITSEFVFLRPLLDNSIFAVSFADAIAESEAAVAENEAKLAAADN
jgi:hypothetical protein